MPQATRKPSAAVIEKNDYHDRLGRRIRNDDGTLVAPAEPGPGVKKVHNLRTLPVPNSIIEQLPVTRWLFEALFALVESGLPQLKTELKNAARRDHVSMARAYVALYKFEDCLKEEFIKPFGEIFREYDQKVMPDALESAGVTNVPLTEGIRVQRSQNTRASIREGMRQAAYKWLVDNDHQDIISETVNSSTLSSLARQLMEQDNKELPDGLFNVALVPTMSVTKIASKTSKPVKE